jgi:cobalamin synthase
VKIFAITLCLIGCLLFYFSHRHQNLFKQTLSKRYSYVGICFIVISLLVLFLSVPKLVAVYMWLITMLVAWTFIPFVVLFKKNIPDEKANSTRNSA